MTRVEDLVRKAFRAGKAIDLREVPELTDAGPGANGSGASGSGTSGTSGSGTSGASGPRADGGGPGGSGLPEVRAEILAGLLTDDRAARLAIPTARLSGARIVGRLRLEGAVIPAPVYFVECEFDQPIELPMARLEGLSLAGCTLTGMYAANLRVAAELNLRGVTSTGTIVLNDATIGGTLRLESARLRCPGRFALMGERMSVQGALYARRLHTHGELRIPGARIVGNINLGGATLSNPGGDTLDANGIHVDGSVLASRYARWGRDISRDPADVFVSHGRMLLSGARVGGDLVLSGACIERTPPDPSTLPGPPPPPTRPDQPNPTTQPAESRGTGGRISPHGEPDPAIRPDESPDPGGQIPRHGPPNPATRPDESPDVDGERPGDGGEERVPAGVERNRRLAPRGIVDESAYLVADRIRVAGNVELDDGFRGRGTVRLPNARIGGYLRLSGAHLRRAEGQPAAPLGWTAVTVLGDGMEIGGDLVGRDDGAGPLRVTGQLRLVGARVRGSASLTGIRLHAPGGDALYADALHVGSMLFFRFARVEGSVRLQGVRVGASVDCAGTRLSDPRIRPNGSAKPSLDLRAAELGKDLFCNDGFAADGGVRLSSAEVTKSVVLADTRLGCAGPPRVFALDADGLVTGELTVQPSEPPAGKVRLTRARVRSWRDNEAVWRAGGGMSTDGFEYASLGTDASVAERLRWLEGSLGDQHYLPGPYEQLAAAYRADGRDDEAGQVMVARNRRRYATLGPVRRIWGELQRWTVGFGYRPALAVAWLALFWLVGGLWFTGHPLQPIDTGQRPVWNPWLYAADMLIPIVNLGEKGYWRAEAADQWITSGLVVVGWILATTAASGVARVLKRQ